MKSLVLFLFLALMIASPLLSQPLSGEFTVGGSAPNFTTLQDAADALKSRGVSGPVTFNIRPGIYMRDGGLSSVMVLDSIIAGISPINRMTFQPDEAAGGNVENVILQIDQTTQTPTALVSIQTDYTTIRNLTFQDIDSAEAGARYLLEVKRYYLPIDLTIEGIIVEGCRFIGNSNPAGGSGFGTVSGVYGSRDVSDIVVRRNSFQRLQVSVHIDWRAGVSIPGSVIVEDNEILTAHFTEYLVSSGIEVLAHNVIVRRNYLDNAGGRGSIFGIVVSADSGLIERNYILNGGGGQVPYYTGISVGGLYGAPAASMTVVNNMISGMSTRGTLTYAEIAIGIDVTTRKVKIIHNTIVNSGGPRSRLIQLSGSSDSCTVLNNILVEYAPWNGFFVASRVLFDQTSGMSGLISDYNVFYKSDSLTLIAQRGGNLYSTLSSYQAASGLDSHSVFKNIDFASDSLYPHLSDCQAQDPELAGIPYPGIVDDIDGGARSVTTPTRGADEGRLRSNPMFEDAFRYQLPGYPYAIAAGKYDNLMVDGLAVTDYTNSRVLLFHNLPSSRSFLQTGILNTGFQPTTLAFYDFDEDSNLDLIVGGDTSSVKVFWGDGAGGFPEMTEVGTYGRTYHLVPEPYQLFDSLRLVFVAHPAWVGSSAAFTGLVMNLGNRQLCYDILRSPNGVDPDTLLYGPWSIVVGNFGGDNRVDIAGIDPLGYFSNWEFQNFYMIGVPCGNNGIGREGPYRQFSGIGGNGTTTNTIIMGDFDGDTDRDFITTVFLDNEYVLLRNEGNFNFQLERSPVNNGMGFAKLDYDNDGDLDFVSVNRYLEDNGITVFLNDGTGHFTYELNCYQRLATGFPHGIVASDFDLDGKTDLAIVSTTSFAHDSLFVLYNFGNVTGIGDEPSSQTPTTFSLSQNYPNPFNPSTRIEYALPVQSHVSVKIYNLLGQEVASLVDEEQLRGHHAVEWNGRSPSGFPVSSGVYFYRIQARQNNGLQQFMSVKKMLLVK